MSSPNIEDLKDKRFWVVRFEEEFCWEIQEDGFVVIVGEDHFAAFCAKVAERLEEEGFHFLPNGKFTELESENTVNLHIGYARDYLLKVVERAREITFEEFLALNSALGFRSPKTESNPNGSGFQLHAHTTNEYVGGNLPKHLYFAWGYSLFYSTIMDDD